MASLELHGLATLHQTPSKFFIQPSNEPEEALIINRQNGEVTLNQMFSASFLPHNVISSPIEGIIGIKHLVTGSHLIVVKKSLHVGTVGGHHIYKVEQAEIIPFQLENNPNQNGNDDCLKWDEIYSKMLYSVLKTPNFYFSLTCDLTNSIQRNFDNYTSNNQTDAYQYYDQRFLWNSHLMSDFDRCGSAVARYRLPFIQGFVSINENALGKGTNWSLISRRSVRRAGTRFNTRGIDLEGNVANFVETEQILEHGDYLRTSFIQIRGSIPLVWSQKPENCKYKPKIVIHNQDHESVMKIHLGELTTIYGNVSIVSLIDSRGHESDLAHEFNRRMSNLQEYYNIPYHYFDFHKECSKMRWHRLSILIERLEPEITAHGFFAINGNDVIRRQTGVVRSNCIDSLDRTNVVQSMIAQHVLQIQFDAPNQETRGLSLSNYPVFMRTFKNVWADNADALSVQYAGTPALKTDFTRTGQRTHTGMFRDGINSLTRYITNNFFDTYRQDAIDLFLGNFIGYPSPLFRPMELKSYTSKFSVTIVMLTLVALYLFFGLDWNQNLN